MTTTYDVRDLAFNRRTIPVESDVSLIDHDLTVHARMTRGFKWRAIDSTAGGFRFIKVPRTWRRSGIWHTRRMRAFVTCELCHGAAVIQGDHYGGPVPLKESWCADCWATFARLNPYYHYDDLPLLDLKEYQAERRSEPTGEQRLAAAMLHAAAADIWRDTKYHGAILERLSAFRWIYADVGFDSGLSFETCCAFLKISPQAARHWIFTTAERHREAHASQRIFVGNYEDRPAVDRDVPDVDGSDRSSLLARIKKVTNGKRPTPEIISAVNFPDD